MKKQELKKFDFAKGKVSEVDAGELLRFRQAVRGEVVKPTIPDKRLQFLRPGLGLRRQEDTRLTASCGK
jgi:hypothetical protein